MRKKRVVILLPVLSGLIVAGWFLSASYRANRAVSVQFVSLENRPGRGTAAKLLITNHTSHMIVCQSVGYLDSGESRHGSVPVPPGAGPWRASVLWQCADLTRFDTFMNRMRRRWDQRFGTPPGSPDAWFPLKQRSTSDEIPR